MMPLRHSFIAVLFLAACTGPAVKGYTYSNEKYEPGHVERQGATATSSSIPLDKRYDELTAEQQKVVLSDYGKLGPGDEPPFPAQGLGPVVRQVTELQGRRLAEGPTDMVVRVDARGQPTSVAVYRSNAYPEMTQALAYVLMHTQYKPAKCQGRPCEGEYLFSFDFGTR